MYCTVLYCTLTSTDCTRALLPQRHYLILKAIQHMSSVDSLDAYSFEDAIEEVHTRFIINLPDSELETADRIFFQLEQAWWFYEDFLVDRRPNLPHLDLKRFSQQMFEYSPLLPSVEEFSSLYNKFAKYRRKITNYGCILLSADCSEVVLCRVWNGKSFTLPAGKINQGEDGKVAAARETYEETGFDPSCSYGTTASWRNKSPDKITWKPLQDENKISITEDGGKQRVAYVVANIPKDFDFEPVARKEVSQIGWFPVDDIPRPNFGVIPFLPKLRKWIKQYRKANGIRVTPKRHRGTVSQHNSRNNTPHSRASLDSCLVSPGEATGWSEEDMFRVNEKLTGEAVEYDGNPHVFAEVGLAQGDPHAYRVVGGAFLNANGDQDTDTVEGATDTKQPSVHKGSDGDDLIPFFGSGSLGDVNNNIEKSATKRSRRKRSGKKTAKQSQRNAQSLQDPPDISEQIRLKHERDYEADMAYIRDWVSRLPQPRPTKHFGVFKLDIDEVMRRATVSW